MNFLSSEPTSISPCSSEDEAEVNVDLIIQNSKLSQQCPLSKPEAPADSQNEDQQLDQIELEMLVQQCEELIAKISPSIQSCYLPEETTVISEIEESFSMKKEKNRLEKEYIDLCLEIQRQQKELQNYRLKVQVAQKQAEYYSRQIKEKTAILEDLEQHSFKKGRQSFRK